MANKKAILNQLADFFAKQGKVLTPSEYKALSKDSWFKETISFPLEKETSCLPTTDPFLSELKLIFLAYGKDFLLRYFFPINL